MHRIGGPFTVLVRMVLVLAPLQAIIGFVVLRLNLPKHPDDRRNSLDVSRLRCEHHGVQQFVASNLVRVGVGQSVPCSVDVVEGVAWWW